MLEQIAGTEHGTIAVGNRTSNPGPLPYESETSGPHHKTHDFNQTQKTSTHSKHMT